MRRDVPRRRITAPFVGLLFVAAAAMLFIGSATAGSTPSASKTGALDCNGWSTIQHSIKTTGACTDIRGIVGVKNHNTWGGRFYDNGHYIGHDEPDLTFLSHKPGSGNDVTWTRRFRTIPSRVPPSPPRERRDALVRALDCAVVLDGALQPEVVSAEPVHSELGLNAPKGQFTGGGSSFLEVQFYPPGEAPFFDNISCDNTHWCASLHINDLECTFGFDSCNAGCEAQAEGGRGATRSRKGTATTDGAVAGRSDGFFEEGGKGGEVCGDSETYVAEQARPRRGLLAAAAEARHESRGGVAERQRSRRAREEEEEREEGRRRTSSERRGGVWGGAGVRRGGGGGGREAGGEGKGGGEGSRRGGRGERGEGRGGGGEEGKEKEGKEKEEGEGGGERRGGGGRRRGEGGEGREGEGGGGGGGEGGGGGRRGGSQCVIVAAMLSKRGGGGREGERGGGVRAPRPADELNLQEGAAAARAGPSRARSRAATAPCWRFGSMRRARRRSSARGGTVRHHRGCGPGRGGSGGAGGGSEGGGPGGGGVGVS